MSFLIEQFLVPLTHRIATNVGTALAAFGMASGDISTVVAAVPIVLGFAIDLVVRRIL